MPKTLEDYLRSCITKDIIDFQVRSTINQDDHRITFYIHPEGKDGETADFEVDGNKLVHNRDISYDQKNN